MGDKHVKEGKLPFDTSLAGVTEDAAVFECLLEALNFLTILRSDKGIVNVSTVGGRCRYMRENTLFNNTHVKVGK